MRQVGKRHITDALRYWTSSYPEYKEWREEQQQKLEEIFNKFSKTYGQNYFNMINFRVNEIHINIEEDRAYRVVSKRHINNIVCDVYTLTPLERYKSPSGSSYYLWSRTMNMSNSFTAVATGIEYVGDDIEVTEDVLKHNYMKYDDTYKLLYGVIDDRFIDTDYEKWRQIKNQKNEDFSHNDLRKSIGVSPQSREYVERAVPKSFKKGARNKKINTKHQKWQTSVRR